jgi:hypothetical protein
MPQPPKPRDRSGYTREETLQVESALLTVAVTLGAYLDDICIVGGLVPSLLIDLPDEIDTNNDDNQTDDDDDHHPGTNDLDIALAVGLLDDGGYSELASRLRQEGFEPDVNEEGHEVRQRWKLRGFKVTIDFLIPPLPGHEDSRRIQDLEPDFGAVVARGLELAFDETVKRDLSGYTLKGEKVIRTIPVCGPAAFTVLKAFAFNDRGEPKDAFDLTYVLARTDGGPEAIAERLAVHAQENGERVRSALDALTVDFASIDAIGPRRAGEFEGGTQVALDQAAADAQGLVADLLDACQGRGLVDDGA